MKAEKAVIDLLLANAAVMALVGDRVWPMLIPEGSAYPCITVERISGTRLIGPLMAGADPGAVDARLQVTAWGSAYLSAKEAAEAVRIALERFSGTVSGIEVWDIVPATDGPDLFDQLLNLYGAPADYIVSHPE